MADHSMIADLRIAEMLSDILDSGRIVLISKDAEGEYFGDASERKSAASTLEGCIEGLTDTPRVKVCLRGPECVSRGRPKPLWTFGPDKDSADGHASVCKSCEAKRISNISKRKKEATHASP